MKKSMIVLSVLFSISSLYGTTKTIYCQSQETVNKINNAQNANQWQKVVRTFVDEGCAESRTEDRCFHFNDEYSDTTKCIYPVTITSWEKFQQAARG